MFRIHPVRLVRLLLILLHVSFFFAMELGTDEEDPVTVDIVAVLGRRAELPCDISPPPADSLYLVLWYRNDSDFPICKYDARAVPDGYPFRMGEQNPIRPRGHFKTNTNPAVLVLNHVEERDEGIYRCRVDFGRSPTRNTLVNLTVIVPPQKLRIIDEFTKEVTSVVGPYEEGTWLSLNCLAIGGRPKPEVTWWMEEEQVDQTYESTFPGVVQNTLILKRLERHHLHTRLRCEARNTNLTEPTVSTVQVDLYLKPLTVSIQGGDKALSAGRRYDLECTAFGSRPAATLVWHLHQNQMPTTERASVDGNMTSSILRLVPTPRDHGAVIACTAVNPFINGSTVEARKTLNVHFAPHVHLELGRNLNPDGIEEGNDVYFECKIDANPAPNRITWSHEGNPIRDNAPAGVIIVDQSLVLRRVSRAQSGRYSCIATNTEGTATSNPVNLRVMHKPLCRGGQTLIYGVAKGESVQVRCQADAIPKPFVYRWAFNASTAEIIELASQKHDAEHDGSVLKYSPQADRDYGSLLCWSKNQIGEQSEPCVFYIIQGGRPDSPANCSVMNQTSESLEVWCRPGFDGGRPQQFRLEIYDTQTAMLLYNRSKSYPHFWVNNLESGLRLRLQVSAFNSRGRSDNVPLEGFTLKPAEKQTVIMEVTDFASVLGIGSGVCATILLVCVVIGLTSRLRQRDPRRPAACQDPVKIKNLQKINAEDEGNPDIIPDRCGDDINNLDCDGPESPDSNAQILENLSALSSPSVTSPIVQQRTRPSALLPIQTGNNSLNQVYLPDGEASHLRWNSYSKLNGSVGHLNSQYPVVVSELRPLGRVQPGVQYYHTLPHKPRFPVSTLRRNPVEVVTTKNSHWNDPETSI